MRPACMLIRPAAAMCHNNENCVAKNHIIDASFTRPKPDTSYGRVPTASRAMSMPYASTWTLALDAAVHG